MSNQTILWGMLILPWLTLFFMPKEDIKKWMPAALFVMVSSTLIIDGGVGLKLFEIRENIYPFNEMISYIYGALPIGSMWILKYTYGRLWLYTAIQLVGSFILMFLVQPWLHRRGILVWLDETDLGGMGAFITTLVHLISVYGYQVWQDSAFVQTERIATASFLQPAAAKPLEQGSPEDNES